MIHRYTVLFAVVLLFILGGIAGKLLPKALTSQFTPSMQAPNTKDRILSTVPKTNAWFSSAYQFPSYPIYTYPGVFRFSPEGLEIGYPAVNATEKLISAHFSPTCFIGLDTPVTKSSVKGYGDWNATISVGNDLEEFQTHLVQGSPVTYLSQTSILRLRCPGALIEDSPLGVQADLNGRKIVFQAKDGTIERANEREAVLSSQANLFRIVMLPTNAESIISKLSSLPWTLTEHTQASYTIEDGSIQTTYRYIGQDDQPIWYTTWPHQTVTAPSNPAITTYETVNGLLTLREGTAFTTSVPVPSLPFTFSKVNDIRQQEEIKTAIHTDAKNYLSGAVVMPVGVYFKGTWIGALTSLVQLADLYDLKVEREQLLDLLQKTITDSTSLFRYDELKKMLIATNAEFGNELGNDHHFHYAYYIRAAAVLSALRPQLQSELEPMVTQQIADIASWEDTTNRYPRMRMFSIFEGHGWADGRAAFADGNNEESSSESLNAWYAISLWGQVIKNQELQNRAAWLFSQDLAGIKTYWFGENNPFPTGYNRPIASLIWGGKREFATWFSADPMHVYGIQWLPITPASAYLKTIKTQPAILSELQRTVATPASHEWGDIFTGVLSYTSPTQALQQKNNVQSTAGLKIKSLLLQTVYQNAQ